MRLQHQIRQAATGVRTKTSTQLLGSSKTTSVNNNEHDEDDPKASRTKILKSIVQRWHEVMREQKDLAVRTGLERGAQWKTSAKGAAKTETQSGNAANAAAVGTESAKTASLPAATDLPIINTHPRLLEGGLRYLGMNVFLGPTSLHMRE